MKRVLSWFVLAACAYVAMLLYGLIMSLAMILFGMIHNSSAVVFWVIVILLGSVVLSLFGFLLYLFSHICVKASDSVCRSDTGRRYKVTGILIAAYNILLLIGLAVGFVGSRNNAVTIISNIVSALFGVFIIIAGASRD